jgi:hypothetical protein
VAGDSFMEMTSVLDTWLEPVITPDVAQRLVALRASEELEPRVHELGQKANEGLLTPKEREEYDAYISANEIIALLQAKARKVLKRHAE